MEISTACPPIFKMVWYATSTESQQDKILSLVVLWIRNEKINISWKHCQPPELESKTVKFETIEVTNGVCITYVENKSSISHLSVGPAQNFCFFSTVWWHSSCSKIFVFFVRFDHFRLLCPFWSPMPAIINCHDNRCQHYSRNLPWPECNAICSTTCY